MAQPPTAYDVVVIGGGSGGLAFAKEAAGLGKNVAVLDFVEPSARGSTWGLGGTCVNVGCIPKKLMHHAALLRFDFEDAPSYGWRLDPTKIEHEWTTLVKNVGDHIHSLNWNYKRELTSKKIAYLNAFGVFVDPHAIECTSATGAKQIVTGNEIVIACGGRPVYPEIPGAREFGITSDDIFSLGHPPGKTLVVGASYVSLECAGFLTHLGFDTTVMVRSILLRGFDQEMANRIGDYMAAHGTKFIRETIPKAIVRLPEGRLRVSWSSPDGAEVSDLFDTVLFAIGRAPSTFKLHLERAGVVADPKTGKVLARNEQTNIPHIFCIGDALQGAPELTPTAILAGQLLARRLYGGSSALMRYEHVPTAVFTPLEYGSIGLSEEHAIEVHGEANVEVWHSTFAPLEWSVVEHREPDVCYLKLISLKTEGGRVVGLHYLGPNAAEVTNGWAVSIRKGATKADFEEVVGIHPSCAENLNTVNVSKSSGASAKKGGC